MVIFANLRQAIHRALDLVAMVTQLLVGIEGAFKDGFHPGPAEAVVIASEKNDGQGGHNSDVKI